MRMWPRPSLGLVGREARRCSLRLFSTDTRDTPLHKNLKSCVPFLVHRTAHAYERGVSAAPQLRAGRDMLER